MKMDSKKTLDKDDSRRTPAFGESNGFRQPKQMKIDSGTIVKQVRKKSESIEIDQLLQDFSDKKLMFKIEPEEREEKKYIKISYKNEINQKCLYDSFLIPDENNFKPSNRVLKDQNLKNLLEVSSLL